ncbi:hypothetical protein BDN71DRAFT_600681 [Pleurotus eryngii]|uniref:Uncharacterized protein n=1 Tax=Pleurotus eryngii TaxID=5323 RepID=A0A9P6D8I9_PLEER|nr:hypothetical protein BDN71DRAFT_600681 [Pleurotus eryngii]
MTNSEHKRRRRWDKWRRCKRKSDKSKTRRIHDTNTTIPTQGLNPLRLHTENNEQNTLGYPPRASTINRNCSCKPSHRGFEMKADNGEVPNRFDTRNRAVPCPTSQHHAPTLAHSQRRDAHFFIAPRPQSHVLRVLSCTPSVVCIMHTKYIDCEEIWGLGAPSWGKG